MGVSKRRSYTPLREKGVNRVMFSRETVFNPQDEVLEVWNKMFVVCCSFAVSCDPLLFYVPYIDDNKNCMDIELDVAMIDIMLRTLLDAFYCVRIFFQVRTQFVAPSSLVSGRGEFVSDSAHIFKHYIRGQFLIDLLSILPLPQILIWFYFNLNTGVRRTREALLFIVLLQYIPRFLRIFPLASELTKTAGIFAQSAVYGVICYLMLFVLSSHILGSVWYLLAVQRNGFCWEKACAASDICQARYLYCSNHHEILPTVARQWKDISETLIENACSMKNDDNLSPGVVKFGIYKQALESDIFLKDNFLSKYIYCVWWGLQNLSTLGQGLEPSMDPGEIAFTIALAVFGIVFFGLLIGNVQIYLQSLSLKMDETRLQRRNAEEWMQHRAVPQDLKERFRRYEQYRWIETKGVDEESLVQRLSTDLRKDIKRHVYLSLVKRVRLFSTMDERFLDAICERLKPCFYIENTRIVYEGKPVHEILIIARGQLESVTMSGSRSVLKVGDFFGDELLAWSVNRRSGSPSHYLPKQYRPWQRLRLLF